jgi:hypothetical protein
MTFILHTSGPVKIGTSVIGGVRNLGSALGNQVRGEPSSGEVFSRLIGLYGQKPTVSFGTESISDALSACGPLGVPLATKNLILYGSKILAGGAIDTSGHISLTCALGILFPKTLTCAHQGDATITYDAILYSSDGGEDPFVLSSAATLPAMVGIRKWTMGPIVLGNTTITQDINVSIDFGLRCAGQGSDSNIRDQIAYIEQVEPKITVSSSKNGQILDLLGVGGPCSVVLRDRVAGGGFGNGTITLTATRGLSMQDTPFAASGHRPGEIGLTGHIYWDGTNAPLTYTLAN